MATRMMPSTAPPLASRCRRTPLTVAAHPRDSTVRVSRGSELHGGGAKYLAASRPHAGHSSDEIVRLRADKAIAVVGVPVIALAFTAATYGSLWDAGI
ncbi:hypothetical protein FOA52_013324 [Chlamydomonas sp. UWO 241]|nr:hypothetical protein FOA52_013324 [Chlamydomonas sp. UWO 241]